MFTTVNYALTHFMKYIVPWVTCS